MSFDVSGNAYDRFMGRYALELAPAFADFVGVHEGKVVDVGCGSGILTEELARRVGAENVAAADPSPLLETCRERVPEADVRPGTAEELPWTDDTFDAALAQLVLHFLDDPVVGITEMRRVTRPGGVVAASTWNFPPVPLNTSPVTSVRCSLMKKSAWFSFSPAGRSASTPAGRSCVVVRTGLFQSARGGAQMLAP